MAESEKNNETVVQIARKRFDLAESMNSASRQQAVADTQFAMGDSTNNYQWPEAARKARQFDARVCLTVNHAAKHCDNIINQIRRNRPSCRVMPVDNHGDKKTAEIISGLIRNIQNVSSADDCHDLAAEHSVFGGEGFWRITTDFETPESFDQVINIVSCPNPQLIQIDPHCKKIDKSDAKWGFIFEDVEKGEFAEEYPDIDTSSWVDSKTSWVAKDTIRIAEYFFCVEVEDTLLLLEDGTTALVSELSDNVKRDGDVLTNTDSGETIQIVKERKTERNQWKWCKLVGANEEPVDLKDWPGDYLPIISVVGKEVNVNGEIIRKGLVRDLADPARMVNYMYSEAIQTIALQNKVPYMSAAEAIEGHEQVWKSANIENRAYLPFNAYDDDGRPLPAPSRQQPAIMPSAQINMLQLSLEEMRGVSGQQNANFGIKSEASSGIGIQRLNAQSEISTFHFPDNLARALKLEAVILINLIQKIYDTKRVVRVFGLDGQVNTATLDPEHPSPYDENEFDDGDIQKIFNPGLGRYDVVIDAGPSFQTQRQEAFAALTDLAAKSPALMNVAGDLIMRAADFPMANELADRIEKTLPPNLQPQKQGGKEAHAAQLAQQAQQMQQQLQQMQMQLQDATQKLQVADSGQARVQAEIQAKMQLAQMDAQLQDAKQQREIESRQKQAEIDADLKIQMMELDLQFKRDQIIFERQLEEQKQLALMEEKRIIEESAMAVRLHQAELDQKEAEKTACADIMKTRMEIESREEIAELNAYVEMQKANIQPPEELTSDVKKDLSGENKSSIDIKTVIV